jgi:hypothetical protein
MTPYDIRVIVIGRPNAGKTAITGIIERAIRAAGFDQVKVEDDTVPGKALNEPHQRRVAAVVAKNPRILIQTGQKTRTNDDFAIIADHHEWSTWVEQKHTLKEEK